MTVEAVLENGVVNCVFYVGPVRHNQDHPSAVLERYVRTPDFVPMSFGGSADDY